MKMPTVKPASFAGPAAGALKMAKPQAPGGGGFLINPHAFSDVRPPRPGKGRVRTPQPMK